MGAANEEALPKQVFCRREHDPNDEEGSYLLADEDPADCAEVGKVVTAGRYELVETVEITAEPSVVTVEKKE